MARHRWNIDSSHSGAQFVVRHMVISKVRGTFEKWAGTIDFDPSKPEASKVSVRIEAASVNTHEPQRDQHLRSADFFDVEKHPQVRFESDHAELDGERLNVYGRLHAAGKKITLDVAATLRPVADELELAAATSADQRRLGMTWSPLGMIHAPSALIIRGRLIPDDRTPRA